MPQKNTSVSKLNSIAGQYIIEGKLDSAVFILNKLIEISVNAGDTLSEIRALSILAEVYQQKNSLEKAIGLLDNAKDLALSYYKTEQTSEFADIYQYYGAIRMEMRNLEEAKKLLFRSIKIRKVLNNDEDTSLAYAYNKLGTVYWYKQMHDSSLHYYQKALEVSLNKKSTDKHEKASYYQNVGLAYLNLVNYEQAEKYLLNSLKLKQKLLTQNDPRLARIYLNLGLLYFKVSLINKALYYYQLAEEIYLKNYASGNDELAALYWNIGNYYNILGDFNKSLAYLNKAEYIYNKNQEKNYAKIIRLHADIGKSYFLSGDYNEAIDNYLFSLKTKNDLALIRSYRNLARSYEYLGEYEKSEYYCEKSIETALKNKEDNKENLMFCYSYYANLLYRINQKKQAFQNYMKAYNLCKELYSEKSRELSFRLKDIGKYYLAENDYSQSLKYLQEALIAGIPDFNDSSFIVNPSLTQIPADNHLFNILSNKANALYKKSINDNNSIHLNISIETYELALAVSDKIIRSYSSESSQLEFLLSVRSTRDKMLNALYHIYLLSNNNNHKEKLFTLAEQSKASILLSALRDMDARFYGNIPYELIHQADELKKNLSYYEKQAYEERLNTQQDASKMTMINNEIFKLKTSYDSLLASLEQNYPSYYKLKYDDKTVTVKEIQERLEKNQVLIEYSISDTILFTFNISPGVYEIVTHSIGKSFINLINNFREILKHDGMLNYDSTDYVEYLKSAYKLYAILLETYSEDLINKEVIIIPDGEIGYLSFDMLLTYLPEQKGLNYRNLPYALKDHIFSYSSSATIHFEEFGSKKQKTHNQLIAFAPNYHPVDNDRLADNIPRNAREKLLPIPGVKEEVKNILNIYSGKMFLDEKATETEFKQLSEDYDILHLAMHTIIDDINPLYSYMVFASDEVDTLNDGLLNTYELFNMNFNGEMAVLSACNTGTGKLEKGEGIMSLARGFIYSGIPSIVMTLWTVEDKSSTELITSFYKYLADDMSKAVAMNKAKIDYLNNAGPLEAHPYFWAGYVNIGDISPLSIKPKNPAIDFLWILLIIPFVILLIRFKRKQKKVSNHIKI